MKGKYNIMRYKPTCITDTLRNNKKKHIFAFISVFAMIQYFATCIASAYNKSDYNGIPYKIAQIFQTRENLLSDGIRSLGFSILCILGKILDYLYRAVITLSKINLYNIITTKYDFEGLVYPIAWAVLTFALVLGAIFLMTLGDKFQISEFVRNSIFSTIFIICLPCFLTAMSDLQTAGIKTVDGISISSSQASLGEQILAENMISVPLSVEENKIIKYADTTGFTAKDWLSPYNIAINQYTSTNDFPYKYTAVAPNTVDIDELSSYYDETYEKAYLLGYMDGYQYYVQYLKTYSSDTITSVSENKVNAHAEYSLYYVGTSTGVQVKKSYKIIKLTKKEYIQSIYNNIKNSPELKGSSMKSLTITDETSLESVFDCVPDNVYKRLAMPQYDKDTENFILANQSFAGQYQLEKLITGKEKKGDNLSGMDKLANYLNYIFVPEGGQAIYYYSFNFIECLIVMLVCIFCLLFSGFKVASLLYDLVFAQIIAPIVIASDPYGSGRTKKIIQEILHITIVFIVVLFTFKLFLIIIMWIISSNYNFIVKIMLVVGGMKFVIDGADLVTKLIGIDAGVKSGYGAMMATYGVAKSTKAIIGATGNVAAGTIATAGNTASQGVSGVTNIASQLKNVPSAIGNGASTGAKLGSKFGNVGKAIGGTIGAVGGTVGSIARTGATTVSEITKTGSTAVSGISSVLKGKSVPFDTNLGNAFKNLQTKNNNSNNNNTVSNNNSNSPSENADSTSNAENTPNNSSPSPSENADSTSNAENTPNNSSPSPSQSADTSFVE